MAALENYTLSTIRTAIQNELGLGSETATMVDARINMAVHHIVRKRQSWPWLLKDYILNVANSNTGTADFTIGSATVANATGSPAVRHIITTGSVASQGLTTGYLLTVVSGGTLTLDAQYTGATAVGADYTSVLAYFQLPSDFSRFRQLFDVVNPDAKLQYLAPMLFEDRRRDLSYLYANPSIYTVLPDPLPDTASGYDANALFLVIYPYLTSRTTIRGQFFADVKNLSADGDIPVIPRKDRLVLYQVALWKTALLMKTELAAAYKAEADEALKDMLSEYAFSTEESNDLRDSKPGWVKMPPGYPDVRGL